MNRVELVTNRGRIKALLGILKLNDEEAYRHSVDVAKITEMYLEEEERSGVKSRPDEEKCSIIAGALLHDIGKGFLPFGLQYSTRTFTETEQEIMKMHPLLGAVAVKDCEVDKIVENIILMHHANLDGTGYPRINNMSYGTDILVPEYVWIVSYADKLDAMISRRSFKRQKSLSEAWDVLVSMSREGKLPYENLGIYRKIISNMDIFKVKPLEMPKI